MYYLLCKIRIRTQTQHTHIYIHTRVCVCIYIKKFLKSNQKLITLVLILGERGIGIQAGVDRLLTGYFQNTLFSEPHNCVICSKKYITSQVVVKMAFHFFRIKTILSRRSHFVTEHILFPLLSNNIYGHIKKQNLFKLIKEKTTTIFKELHKALFHIFYFIIHIKVNCKLLLAV